MAKPLLPDGCRRVQPLFKTPHRCPEIGKREAAGSICISRPPPLRLLLLVVGRRRRRPLRPPAGRIRAGKTTSCTLLLAGCFPNPTPVFPVLVLQDCLFPSLPRSAARIFRAWRQKPNPPPPRVYEFSLGWE